MEQMPLRPFRINTRRKRVQVDSKSFSHGGRATFELPQVGFLSVVYLYLEITFTQAGADALAAFGPWNLLSRIRLKLNLGSQIVWDCTGFESFIMASILNRGGRLDLAGVGSTTVDSDVYAAPVTTGTWRLQLPIPVSANMGQNFEAGLINLQAEQLRFYVEVDFGQVSDAVTTAATFSSGTLYCDYEYYEVPPDDVALPEFVIVKTESERQAITATGDNTVKIQQQGNLMNLCHIVSCNGARSNAVDEFRLKFNKTETIEVIRRQQMKLQQRQLYGQEFPTGVFHHSFWGYADGDPSRGDNRDMIDTEELANFDSIVKITSGTTLGSGNAFIDTIRRYAQVPAI